jgi:hypothetical protein
VYSRGHVTYVLAVNVRRSLVYDFISGPNKEEKQIISVYCVFLAYDAYICANMPAMQFLQRLNSQS